MEKQQDKGHIIPCHYDMIPRIRYIIYDTFEIPSKNNDMILYQSIILYLIHLIDCRETEAAIAARLRLLSTLYRKKLVGEGSSADWLTG